MAKRWMEGMNAEAMDRWMADLRSGEFKQGIGLLRSSDDEMCCMGVVTDTNVESCNLRRELRGGSNRWEYIDQDGHIMGALMPTVVLDYLGIPREYRDTSSYDGSFWVNSDESHPERALTGNLETINGVSVISVISLNDSIGLKFPEIADRIEATFMVETKEN